MSRELDRAFERAVAHDDALDLRRSRRAAEPEEAGRRCLILHHYEEHCDQCARRTWQPHVSQGRTFCRRCCPACARRAACVDSQVARRTPVRVWRSA